MTALVPRPHQLRALDDLRAVLTKHDRATVTLPCGSGKTRLGSLLAERLGAQRTVVFVPSLALVAQTLSEWRATGLMFEALIVCSDRTTADGVQERASLDGGDVKAPFWARHWALVTTSPAAAAAVMVGAHQTRPLVVFCTYHSAPALVQAARHAAVEFDLAIADEAHHLAGNPREGFRTVLADEFPAHRRVFMTATPVTAASGAGTSRISMTDQRLFGPVAHELALGSAIEQGLLADYRVMVFEAPGEADRPNPVSALLAAADRGMSRVLTFHGRVAKARRFAQALDGHELPDGRTVWARCVAGTDSAAKRARILRGLEEVDPATTVAVVASARCLSEGVNLPAIDAVMFADPRSSQTDVVQAAGRVMRTSPGKTHGTILIPVCVRKGLDDDTLLSTSSFAAAWKILRSLRDHDSRLNRELGLFAQGESRHGVSDGSRRPPRAIFQLPSVGSLPALVGRLVQDPAASTSWEEFYAELTAYAAHAGHTRPPSTHRLHEWCQRQRRAHRTGLLLPERAAALRALPGWVWDLDEACFLDQWAAVRGAAGGHLDLFDPQLADRPVPHGRGRARTLGRWSAQQRVLWRRGELPDERRTLIEQIPGWDWSPLGATEIAYVDLLVEYLAWKGHTDVDPGYVDDDLPLGAWLVDVRRRRALGALPQPLLDELTVVTPAPPAAGALEWRTREIRWQLGLEVLQSFVAREGHCRVPDQHREPIAGTDDTFPLYVWCRNQRHERRVDELDPARIAQLDAVPGWRWEIVPGPRVLMDIGDARHGTRTGYVKGCRCEPCTQANRDQNRAREAAARSGGPSTDLVDAAAARGRLRILHGRGATQKALGRATGLNVKSVVEILTGHNRRILPSTEAAILALTLDKVHAAAAPGSLIPAGPTWRLLDDLIGRGWPKAWIARELGMTGSLQLKRSEITAVNADRVARLYRAVGELTPPPRQYRAPLPTLAEILASAPASRSRPNEVSTQRAA